MTATTTNWQSPWAYPVPKPPQVEPPVLPIGEPRADRIDQAIRREWWNAIHRRGGQQALRSEML